MELSSKDPKDVRRLNTPPPNMTVVVDGRFKYHTDDRGRVTKAIATLGVIDLDHPRSKHAQRTLSGKLPGDHAGHLFARIFKGPGQKINLVPMEALKVNHRSIDTLEREWRRLIEQGKEVDVSIELRYPEGGNRRPTHIRVEHVVDGKTYRRIIVNTPKE